MGPRPRPASSHVAASALQVNGLSAYALFGSVGMSRQSHDSGCAHVPKTMVVPELLRTLVFARPCGGDQFAAGTVSPSLDMSR